MSLVLFIMLYKLQATSCGFRVIQMKSIAYKKNTPTLCNAFYFLMVLFTVLNKVDLIFKTVLHCNSVLIKILT